jgi:hypothetical protein
MVNVEIRLGNERLDFQHPLQQPLQAVSPGGRGEIQDVGIPGKRVLSPAHTDDGLNEREEKGDMLATE